MGRYDFFKGECPHCKQLIGMYNGEFDANIQTKMFSYPYFRTFVPPCPLPFILREWRHPKNISDIIRVGIGGCPHCKELVYVNLTLKIINGRKTNFLVSYSKKSDGLEDNRQFIVF